MRRKDREITDINEIFSIIKKCDAMRIALFHEDYPYIVPLNFGCTYDEDNIEFYFHGAKKGLKLDLVEKNNHAAFEMDCSHKLIVDDVACKYTMEFESVCGNGEIIILDTEEKREALTLLMRQYSDDSSFTFSDKALEGVAVFKLKVHSITGKRLTTNTN